MNKQCPKQKKDAGLKENLIANPVAVNAQKSSISNSDGAYQKLAGEAESTETKK